MITSTRRSITREHSIYTLHLGIVALAIILIAMWCIGVTPYLGNFIAGLMVMFATLFIGIKYADELMDPVFNVLGLFLIVGVALVLNYLMTVFKIDYVTVLIMVNLMLLYVYFWNTKNKHEIFESRVMEISYCLFGGVLILYDIVCYLFLNEINIMQIISDVIIYLLLIRLIDKTLIYAEEFRNSAGNVFLAMEKYFTK